MTASTTPGTTSSTTGDEAACRLQSVDALQAELLAGMHRICFSEPWDAKAMRDLLAMPGAYGVLAAGRPEGPPQGFILCRQAVDEAEVLTLLVLPPYRRRGIGQALLAAALERARAAGATRMFLEVAADNRRAAALYAAAGFREVGRRRGYYSGGADALVLCKEIATG